MCGIIGIFNDKGAVDIAVKGMELIKHRGPDGFGFSDGQRSVYAKDFAFLKSLLKGHKAENVLMQALLSIVDFVKQPIDGKFVANCEIYNWKALKKKYGISAKNDAELLYKLLRSRGIGILDEVDGVYSFIYFDGKKVIAARDYFGVKPLCFHYDNNSLYLASENKALGLEGEQLDPRKIIVYDFKRLELVERKPLISGDSLKDLAVIKDDLKKLLVNAVKKRTDLETFGILFSGGIDSVVLAYIAKTLGKRFKLYTSGTENSEDVLWAKKAAKWLGAELVVSSGKDVESYVRKIVPLIETNNFVKVSVAIPFYLACQAAQKDQLKVIFSGLGSEEIFAGYQRHQKSDDINKECIEGLYGMFERDLYRDDLVTMSFGLELRLPFLDKDLVEYALKVDPNYKIKEGIKKYILRLVAVDMGMPEEFAFRKKKAAQYGSGYDKLISKMAKMHNFKSKKKYIHSI